MRHRLPLTLSATALAIALLGSTPLGQAAANVIAKAVPVAKVAFFADNAGKLSGHSASASPTAGQIPVVGASGKLALSILPSTGGGGTPGVAGPAGPAGPAGAAGPSGPTGATGVAGSAGISGYQTVSATKTFAPSSDDSVTASCPSGDSVLGGGFVWVGGINSNVVINVSQPAAGNSGWIVQGQNPSSNSDATVTARAVCAVVG